MSSQGGVAPLSHIFGGQMFYSCTCCTMALTNMDLDWMPLLPLDKGVFKENHLFCISGCNNHIC